MSNTVKIRKGNKVRYVDAGRLNAFLAQGFEQIDKDGKVIKRATGGAAVPVAKYNELLERLEAAKAGGDTAALQAEIVELKKENAALKGKITKLEKAAEAANADSAK